MAERVEVLEPVCLKILLCSSQSKHAELVSTRGEVVKKHWQGNKNAAYYPNVDLSHRIINAIYVLILYRLLNDYWTHLVYFPNIAFPPEIQVHDHHRTCDAFWWCHNQFSVGFIPNPVDWLLVNSAKLLICNQGAVRTKVLQWKRKLKEYSRESQPMALLFEVYECCQ